MSIAQFSSPKKKEYFSLKRNKSMVIKELVLLFVFFV